MFDPCVLNNNKNCAFCCGEFCGHVAGENRISKLKKCPKVKKKK